MKADLRSAFRSLEKQKTDILEEAKKITTLPVDVVEWRVDWFDDVFATEKVLENR